MLQMLIHVPETNKSRSTEEYKWLYWWYLVCMHSSTDIQWSSAANRNTESLKLGSGVIRVISNCTQTFQPVQNRRARAGINTSCVKSLLSAYPTHVHLTLTHRHPWYGNLEMNGIACPWWGSLLILLDWNIYSFLSVLLQAKKMY